MSGKNNLSPATQASYGRAQVLTNGLARFPRAMAEVARIGFLGTQKHKQPQGSMTYLGVPDAPAYFGDKIARHLCEEKLYGIDQSDPEMAGTLHAGAYAWNALARLEWILWRLENLTKFGGLTPEEATKAVEAEMVVGSGNSLTPKTVPSGTTFEEMSRSATAKTST